MSFLRKITESGISRISSESERRNVVLTNYISLVVALVPFMLSFGILFFTTPDIPLLERLASTSILFIIPLLLNMAGFVVMSRIVLAWLPTTVIFAVSIIDVHLGSRMSAASYVGLRLFFIPIGCFPFLVFDLKKKIPLLFALAGPLLGLILFDPIIEHFNAGYLQSDFYDPLYAFNNVRAFVSFIAIGFACFFLKRIVERNERLNEALVIELAAKNELIQKQAHNEVLELNRQLHINLKQLGEREFILNQSQQMAKIGSWEYRIQNAFIFWSDEMYNIFGLDKSFDIKTENLVSVMYGDAGPYLIDTTEKLLQTGEPYDITLRAQTPFGYSKWIRISAFPVKENNKIIGATGICHDITFFREAEDLLRASENKYRSLFEQASDFIMILDFQGNFLDVNVSLCEAFRYSKEELRNLKIENLIQPEELKRRPIMYAELDRGDHVLSDRKMMRKDGSIIEVEANVRKLQDGQMLVIARDVTRLREVQKQIQLSEARFRGAFEYSAIGMALVSLDGQWLKVNKELCQFTGYSEDEFLLMSVRDITLVSDHEIDLAYQQSLIKGVAETFNRERQYIHKDGSLIWVNLNVSVIKDPSGTPQYFVAQIENITDDKKAAEELALSQANLKATINNTKVMIWSVDRARKLIMYNDAFGVFVHKHYNRQIRIGATIFDESTSDGLEITQRWIPHFDRVLAGESFTLEETRFGFDFQYSLSPVLESGQIIGISVFADDVTEWKMRDRELSEANKKIGELKLMALRSVMSPHFIFNVLNSIQFYIAKNDRLNAIHYLSMFSKLMRGILTHSVNNKIKLSDEIEMLTNYVQLEMTRFENKFNFVLDIDPSVEVESIELPSLLIQPYVENAILHGLYNKQDHGTLTVRVRENDGRLTFEIEDDGIGREAATKLRQQSFPAHKSMGIRITEERLKLINADSRAAFAIEDLFNDAGPCGTKVRISITV